MPHHLTPQQASHQPPPTAEKRGSTGPIVAILFLALLALAGCAHVPMTSVPTLSRIDAETTPFASTRVAIIVPEALLPMPDGARLDVALTLDGEIAEQRSYALESLTGVEAEAAIGTRIAESRTAYVYQLSEVDQEGLTAIREQALAARDAGQT